MRILALALSAGLLAGTALAAPADHYTQTDLAKMADGLKTKATNGSASDMLAKYPNHHTMLAYRNKDGNGEVHTQYADIFVIERGKATLLTEGTLDGAHEEGPGEIRGTAVQGGKAMPLTAGDVIHIPAGTPHQMLVAPGDEVVYFVVKIKEN